MRINVERSLNGSWGLPLWRRTEIREEECKSILGSSKSEIRLIRLGSLDKKRVCNKRNFTIERRIRVWERWSKS